MTDHNNKALPGSTGIATPKQRFSFNDVKDSIAGREEQILEALGIPWESKRPIHCPFYDHDDKTPSWRWDNRRSKFFCSCGHGDVFDVVSRVLGISMKDAAGWIINTGYIRTDPALIQSAVAMKREKLEQALIEDDLAAIEATATDQRNWTEAKPATGNLYSQNKGLAPLGCRQDGQILLAPLTDRTGTIKAVEYIHANGFKATTKGAAVRGLSFKVGRVTNGVINVCEGVADAWAIHDATGEAVAACRGTGNLPAVVHLLADQFQNHRIVIHADGDAAGLRAAQKAVELVERAEVIYPPSGCKDPWETWAAERGDGVSHD